MLCGKSTATYWITMNILYCVNDKKGYPDCLLKNYIIEAESKI